MEHLKRMEDLTRRYASTRIGAAGLGALWAFILAAALVVMISNHIYAEFAASGSQYASVWRFLMSDTLIISTLIKVAAIAVSILTWLGVTCLQILVDKRMGVAIHNDPTSKLMRFLVPVFFIISLQCVIGYNLGQALAIRDNLCDSTVLSCENDYGNSLFEIIDISSYLGWGIITAWGVIWAFSTRDASSRTLAVLMTLMLFPVMSSTFNEMHAVLVIFQLMLLLSFAMLGLRQLFAFLKVRNEINALPVCE